MPPKTTKAAAPFRLLASPLTLTIYAGRVKPSSDGRFMEVAGPRHDVTNDWIDCARTFIGENKSRDFDVNGKPFIRITVTMLDPETGEPRP